MGRWNDGVMQTMRYSTLFVLPEHSQPDTIQDRRCINGVERSNDTIPYRVVDIVPLHQQAEGKQHILQGWQVPTPSGS